MTTVSYDRAVPYYDTISDFPTDTTQHICDAIIEHTQATLGSKFLEIGIGTGLIGASFWNLNYKYVGVDISAKMMTQIPPKLTHNRIAVLIQADIEKPLPFPDQLFDVICAFRTMHLLDKWEFTIREAKRILKPTGYLIIARDISDKQVDNMLKSVHTKWNDILTRLNVSKELIRARRWLSNDILIAYLQAQGASTRTIDLARYDSSPISVRELANRHQMRMYNRDWNLPDIIHRRASQELYQWINTEHTEPDHEIQHPMIFRAVIAHWG